MSVVEYLKSVRANVEQGWTQGAYDTECDGTTCYCTVGAFYEGPYQPKLQVEAMKVLASVIRPVRDVMETTGLVEGALIQWNDAPHRRKKDVLAAFDRAIRKAEAA